MRIGERKGIACGGNWNVDLTKVIDSYPSESSLANILMESMSGGGGAHNVMINLAKFDDAIDLYALGVVGIDAYGDYIVDECRQFHNVHIDQLRRTNLAKTSYTDVLVVKSTGRRTFLHYRGANSLFRPESVELDTLPVEIFHFAYPLLLDAMDQGDHQFRTVAARFLCEIQSKGIKTSIDFVSERSDRFDLIIPPALKYINYCLTNDLEAERLAGVPIRFGAKVVPGNLKMIATRLFQLGVNDMVVVHFPEGAYFLTKDGTEVLQPSLELPAEFIIGSAGAGDAFGAGFLYGLYNHWSLEKTARFAVCAGGINLSELSTTGGTAAWEEVFAMQEKFPFRRDILA